MFSISYGTFKRTVNNVTLLCIIINLLVKLGLIFGYQHKWVLVVGAIIDFCGVWFIAKYGKY
jgi:hypothetical protein